MEYEERGQYQLGKFAFDLVLKIQEELKMGDVIYNELKNILAFKQESPTISIQSKSLQKYVRRSAFRTFDEKVIQFVNL